MTIGQKLVSDMGVSQKDYDHFILDLDQIKKESNSYVRQTMKGEVSAHYLTTFHSQELADIMEVKIEDLSTKAVDFKTHVEQFDLYTQTLINRLEKSATCPESKYRYCAIKNQLNTIQDEIEVLYVAVEKSIKIAERMFFPRFIELSDSLEGFLSSSALNSPKFVKQELYRFCRKMSAITLDIEDQIRLSNPDFEWLAITWQMRQNSFYPIFHHIAKAELVIEQARKDQLPRFSVQMYDWVRSEYEKIEGSVEEVENKLKWRKEQAEAISSIQQLFVYIIDSGIKKMPSQLLSKPIQDLDEIASQITIELPRFATDALWVKIANRKSDILKIVAETFNILENDPLLDKDKTRLLNEFRSLIHSLEDDLQAMQQVISSIMLFCEQNVMIPEEKTMDIVYQQFPQLQEQIENWCCVQEKYSIRQQEIDIAKSLCETAVKEQQPSLDIQLKTIIDEKEILLSGNLREVVGHIKWYNRYFVKLSYVFELAKDLILSDLYINLTQK